MNGELISLAAITLPMFVLGTEADHVAPWKSAYKARALTRSKDYTFALVSAGHNGGIVCGPENPKRRFRELTSKMPTPSLAPDEWLQRAWLQQGSWWPSWQAWLAAHSGPPDAGRTQPRQCRRRISGIGTDAPGSYVLQR